MTNGSDNQYYILSVTRTVEGRMDRVPAEGLHMSAYHCLSKHFPFFALMISTIPVSKRSLSAYLSNAGTGAEVSDHLDL
jgi:hypothetical protein